MLDRLFAFCRFIPYAAFLRPPLRDKNAAPFFAAHTPAGGPAAFIGQRQI